MSNNKDWTGNKKSVFATLGASSHGSEERQTEDFYATDPQALRDFLNVFELPDKKIWEPAVGKGHLADVLKEFGHEVKCSDIVDRGYEGTELKNFLLANEKFEGSIVTNPPYKYAQDFVNKSLDSIAENHYVIMLLQLRFLESKGRRKFFDETPPEYVYVASSRIDCCKNGEPLKYKGNSAVAYAWFVWRKGFYGEPKIRWFR